MITLRLLCCVALAPLVQAASIDEALATKASGDHLAAEKAFADIVQAEPRNAEAWAQLATLRGWNKRYAESLQAWDQTLALRDDADSRAGKARVLWWKGDRQAALTEIDRALALRPRDAELWALKGDIARADQNRALATTAYREADRLDRGTRTADKLGSESESWEPKPWRVDLTGMRDSYSEQRDIENDALASVGWRSLDDNENARQWWGRGFVEREDRFDAVDWSVGGEGGFRLVDPLHLRLGGTYAPDADFSPDWSVDGGVRIQAHRQVNLFVDLKHAEYRDNDQQVLRVSPAIAYAPLPWLELEGRIYLTTDHRGGNGPVPAQTEQSTAWLAKASFTLAQRFHPYAGYAQGKEPQPPIDTAFTRTIFTGLVYDLDQTISIRIDGAIENRRDQYIRRSIGGGVGIKW